MLQDVGTMKSLHWRCEMWFDCVEQKRSAKLPSSATAPCTFAAAPSFQAYLCAFICTFCMCVCIYVYVCMCARPTHNALLHLALERSVRGLECTQHSVHSKS